MWDGQGLGPHCVHHCCISFLLLLRCWFAEVPAGSGMCLWVTRGLGWPKMDLSLHCRVPSWIYKHKLGKRPRGISDSGSYKLSLTSKGFWYNYPEQSLLLRLKAMSTLRTSTFVNLLPCDNIFRTSCIRRYHGSSILFMSQPLEAVNVLYYMAQRIKLAIKVANCYGLNLSLLPFLSWSSNPNHLRSQLCRLETGSLKW
jgi:hypothetical protein